MKKVLQYALLFGLSFIVYELILSYVIRFKFYHWSMDIFLLIYGVLIFYFLGVQLKKEKNGTMYFGETFLWIFLSASLGSMLYYLLSVIHRHLINPDMAYDFIRYQLDSVREGIFNTLTHEQVIDAKMEILNTMDVTSPFGQMAINNIGAVIFGSFLVAIFVAVIVPRKFVNRLHKIKVA